MRQGRASLPYFILWSQSCETSFSLPSHLFPISFSDPSPVKPLSPYLPISSLFHSLIPVLWNLFLPTFPSLPYFILWSQSCETSFSLPSHLFPISFSDPSPVKPLSPYLPISSLFHSLIPVLWNLFLPTFPSLPYFILWSQSCETSFSLPSHLFPISFSDPQSCETSFSLPSHLFPISFSDPSPVKPLSPYLPISSLFHSLIPVLWNLFLPTFPSLPYFILWSQSCETSFSLPSHLFPISFSDPSPVKPLSPYLPISSLFHSLIPVLWNLFLPTFPSLPYFILWSQSCETSFSLPSHLFPISFSDPSPVKPLSPYLPISSLFHSLIPVLWNLFLPTFPSLPYFILWSQSCETSFSLPSHLFPISFSDPSPVKPLSPYLPISSLFHSLIPVLWNLFLPTFPSLPYFILWSQSCETSFSLPSHLFPISFSDPSPVKPLSPYLPISSLVHSLIQSCETSFSLPSHLFPSSFSDPSPVKPLSPYLPISSLFHSLIPVLWNLFLPTFPSLPYFILWSQSCETSFSLPSHLFPISFSDPSPVKPLSPYLPISSLFHSLIPVLWNLFLPTFPSLPYFILWSQSCETSFSLPSHLFPISFSDPSPVKPLSPYLPISSLFHSLIPVLWNLFLPTFPSLPYFILWSQSCETSFSLPSHLFPISFSDPSPVKPLSPYLPISSLFHSLIPVLWNLFLPTFPSLPYFILWSQSCETSFSLPSHLFPISFSDPSPVKPLSPYLPISSLFHSLIPVLWNLFLPTVPSLPYFILWSQSCETSFSLPSHLFPISFSDPSPVKPLSPYLPISSLFHSLIPVLWNLFLPTFPSLPYFILWSQSCETSFSLPSHLFPSSFSDPSPVKPLSPYLPISSLFHSLIPVLWNLFLPTFPSLPYFILWSQSCETSFSLPSHLFPISFSDPSPVKPLSPYLPISSLFHSLIPVLWNLFLPTFPSLPYFILWSQSCETSFSLPSHFFPISFSDPSPVKPLSPYLPISSLFHSLIPVLWNLFLPTFPSLPYFILWSQSCETSFSLPSHLFPISFSDPSPANPLYPYLPISSLFHSLIPVLWNLFLPTFPSLPYFILWSQSCEPSLSLPSHLFPISFSDPSPVKPLSPYLPISSLSHSLIPVLWNLFLPNFPSLPYFILWSQSCETSFSLPSHLFPISFSDPSPVKPLSPYLPISSLFHSLIPVLWNLFLPTFPSLPYFILWSQSCETSFSLPSHLFPISFSDPSPVKPLSPYLPISSLFHSMIPVLWNLFLPTFPSLPYFILWSQSCETSFSLPSHLFPISFSDPSPVKPLSPYLPISSLFHSLIPVLWNLFLPTFPSLPYFILWSQSCETSFSLPSHLFPISFSDPSPVKPLSPYLPISSLFHSLIPVLWNLFLPTFPSLPYFILWSQSCETSFSLPSHLFPISFSDPSPVKPLSPYLPISSLLGRKRFHRTGIREWNREEMGR